MRKIWMKMFCMMGVLGFLFTACHYDPAVDDQYYLKNGLNEPIKFVKMNVGGVYDTITINSGSSALVYQRQGIDHSYFTQNTEKSGFMDEGPYVIIYSDGLHAYYGPGIGTYYPVLPKSPDFKEYWKILKDNSRRHRDEYVVEYTVNEEDYQCADVFMPDAPNSSNK